MSQKKPESPSKPPPAKAGADRLAAALRDNLKRRKEQARARDQAVTGPRKGD